MNEEFEKSIIEEKVEEKTKKRKKRYIGVAITAIIINVAVVTSVFAFGYLFGSNGIGLNIASAEKEIKSNIDKLLEARVEDNRVELTTAEVAKLVGPAVVGIVSKVETVDYFWGYSSIAEASGSGIIFKRDGNVYYIITNNHVIDGAKGVSVQVAGDRTFEAELVGTDANTDLAVIKIKSDDELTVAKFGNSDRVEVGEKAIAIGNPLGMEFFGTVTEGIISATNRKVQMSDNFTMNYIQTDAAINNGNSGGALVNSYGEVIGINSAKISTDVAEGIGFAIPISEAKVVANDLVGYGYVKGRPVIGITTVDVTESVAAQYGWPRGVWVNSVLKGSGAEKGGLLRGDIIIQANGKEITSVSELNDIKNAMKPGDSMKLRVYRENRGEIDLTVVLTEDNPISSK